MNNHIVGGMILQERMYEAPAKVAKQPQQTR